MKNKIQIAAGVVSLIALLTYTLVHTGGLLARYVQPGWVGYVAALGIEIAIVSLSLRIGDLRKSGLSPRWFLFVLVSVVVVSALANVAEGFATAKGLPLTWANVQQLDAVEAVIGLSATGLISLIVLALSEIIGSDVQVLAAAVDRERRKTAKIPESDAAPDAITAARTVAVDKSRAEKQDRIDAILDTYRAQPTAQPVEIYRRLNIPRSTFNQYVNELEQAGRIERNGHGVVVRENN